MTRETTGPEASPKVDKDFLHQFTGNSWATWTNDLRLEHKIFLLEVENRVTANVSKCVSGRVSARSQALRLLVPYLTVFIYFLLIVAITQRLGLSNSIADSRCRESFYFIH